MEYQHLLYDKDAPVLTLTFNRPGALNAISPALEQELHVALDAADADEDIRAIILTGAGRAFSAGYDMAPSPERPQNSLDPTGKAIGDYVKWWWNNDTTNIDKLFHIWHLGTPVIAAVNDACGRIGGIAGTDAGDLWPGRRWLLDGRTRTGRSLTP